MKLFAHIGIIDAEGNEDKLIDFDQDITEASLAKLTASIMATAKRLV
jgi:hypothetical protein